MAAGYRSGFEVEVQAQLAAVSPAVLAHYEEIKLLYTVGHTYTPDWRVRTRSGRYWFLEAKGRFTSEDRTKMAMVRDQNPGVDIRFCFQNAHAKIRKGSNTTNANWCDNAGFRWCHKVIPAGWYE